MPYPTISKEQTSGSTQAFWSYRSDGASMRGEGGKVLNVCHPMGSGRMSKERELSDPAMAASGFTFRSITTGAVTAASIKKPCPLPCAARQMYLTFRNRLEHVCLLQYDSS
jgi:hypothetical protein